MKTAQDILRLSVLPRRLDRRVSALRSLNMLEVFARKYDLRRLWPELPYLDFLRGGRRRSAESPAPARETGAAVYATHSHFETNIIMSPVMTRLVREHTSLPVREIVNRQDHVYRVHEQSYRLNHLIDRVYRERKPKYAVPVKDALLNGAGDQVVARSDATSQAAQDFETTQERRRMASARSRPARRVAAPTENPAHPVREYDASPSDWKALAREMMLRGGDVTDTIRDFAAKHETKRPVFEFDGAVATPRSAKTSGAELTPALSLAVHRERSERSVATASVETRAEVKEAVPVGSTAAAGQGAGVGSEVGLRQETIEKSVRRALRNLPQSEVNVFADRVSRSIERRVRIERDWRGDV